MLSVYNRGVYAKSKIDIGIQPSQQTHQHTPSIPKNSPPLPSPSPSPSPTFLSTHACMHAKQNSNAYPIPFHATKQKCKSLLLSHLISCIYLPSPQCKTPPMQQNKTQIYRREVALTICLLLFNQLLGASCLRCRTT